MKNLPVKKIRLYYEFYDIIESMDDMYIQVLFLDKNQTLEFISLLPPKFIKELDTCTYKAHYKYTCGGTIKDYYTYSKLHGSDIRIDATPVSSVYGYHLYKDTITSDTVILNKEAIESLE